MLFLSYIHWTLSCRALRAVSAWCSGPSRSSAVLRELVFPLSGPADSLPPGWVSLSALPTSHLSVSSEGMDPCVPGRIYFPQRAALHWPLLGSWKQRAHTGKAGEVSELHRAGAGEALPKAGTRKAMSPTDGNTARRPGGTDWHQGAAWALSGNQATQRHEKPRLHCPPLRTKYPRSLETSDESG